MRETLILQGFPLFFLCPFGVLGWAFSMFSAEISAEKKGVFRRRGVGCTLTINVDFSKPQPQHPI